MVFAVVLVGAGSALAACGSTTIAAGTGVAGDPYRVTSRADLEQIGASAANMACQYELENDIALGGIGSPWTPLGPGSPATKFTGTLLGNGKTISGLAFSTGGDTVGLFRELGGATISNLTLSGVNITADHQLGAIAGRASAGTNALTAVTVTGSVTASIATPSYGDVGGLVGTVAAGATLSIVSPTASTTVTSSQACVGGLVGENDGTLTVTGADVTATVNGSSAVGGVLGFAPSGSTTSVDGVALAVLIGTGDNVGGVVGFTYSALTAANVSGTVTMTGSSYAGGIAGRTVSGGAISIHDVSLGVTITATGSGKVGGLIGDGSNPALTIADVVLSGSITSASSSDIGGAVGALRLQPGSVPATSIQHVANASMTLTTGGQNVGGVIGSITGGQTTAVLRDLRIQGGTVVGSSRVGGTIGSWTNGGFMFQGQASSLSAIAAHAAVTATGSGAGGIIGHLEQYTFAVTIDGAYADGAVTASSGSAGGLVGEVASSQTSAPLSLTSDYAASVVSGSTKGALVGSDSRTETPGVWVFTGSFWSAGLSTASSARAGSANVYGSTATTATGLATITPYATAGWPIRTGWQDAAVRTDTWGICGLVNGGRPFLMVEYATEPCLLAPGSPAATAGDGRATIAVAAQPAGAVNVTNYEYQLDGGAWTAMSPASTGTSITITGLVNGVSYSVRVRAVGPNGAGDTGPASSAVAVTPVVAAADTASSSSTSASAAAAGSSGSKAPAHAAGALGLRSAPAAVWLDAARAAAAPDAIRTVIRAPGPGSVRQTGVAVGGRRAAMARAIGWRVCTGRTRTTKLGSIAVTCNLTARARAALRDRRLVVRLTIAFVGADGAVERAVRRIVLGRVAAAPAATAETVTG